MSGAGLALALALAAELLPAQAYDPRHAWRTLESPHFRVHFHEGLEPLAGRAAAALERAHAALAPALGHAPAAPVEVVLDDDADDANGSATPVPRNLLRLRAVPPESASELADHADWLETLAFHEYAHVLHLDQIGGLPAAFDRVFGKLWAPSGLGPPWLTEGLAVRHEAGQGAGRNASALLDAWARALALRPGGLPPVDELSNPALDWPLGSVPYLLGGRFLAFLEARSGAGAVRAFLADQGSQVWPYRMNALFERHFGGSVDALWAAFGDELRARALAARAAVRARGGAAPRPLTARGATLSGLRFAPDGASVAWFDQGLDARAALRGAALDGRDLGPLAVVEGNGSFAFLGPREALVAIRDVLDEYRIVDDLYRVELGSGRRTRLTTGERATDPDVAPGGAWAAYVARLPGGELALRRLWLDGSRPPETLLHRPGAQLFLPRISPDGRLVALEIQEGGRRDVAVWDGAALRFVTDDDALDQAPAWAPDGRTIYFASDRGGTFNVHAFELAAPPAPGEPPPTDATPSSSAELPAPAASGALAGPRPRLAGRLRQVTDVETAALQPDVSPDGRTLAFLAIGAEGYDVAALPLEPARWLEPADAGPRSGHAPPPPLAAPPPPSRPYDALATLGPAWWLPLAGGDAAGLTLGALTGGADVVGRHSWGLSAGWGTASGQPSYAAAYAAGWMFPTLALASTRDYAGAPDGRGEVQWVPLDASLTWTRTHLDSAAALTAGWRALLLRPQGAVDPADPSPYRGGTASELTLGLAYGTARRFVRSISPEEGGVVSLRVRGAAPELGGDLGYLVGRLSGSAYLRVPWTRHAVLALHASLGASHGSLPGRQPFSLGGIPAPDLTALVAGALGAGFPVQADQLRGYPSGAFEGASLISTTTELRFPIAAPLLGHTTWPLFLRRLHGAVFLDAGAAFSRRSDPFDGKPRALERLRFGAGGELRLEVVLGYYLRTDLRLGLARGLGPLLAPSPAPPDPLAGTQAYLTVGSSF